MIAVGVVLTLVLYGALSWGLRLLLVPWLAHRGGRGHRWAPIALPVTNVLLLCVLVLPAPRMTAQQFDAYDRAMTGDFSAFGDGQFTAQVHPPFMMAGRDAGGCGHHGDSPCMPLGVLLWINLPPLYTCLGVLGLLHWTGLESELGWLRVSWLLWLQLLAVASVYWFVLGRLLVWDVERARQRLTYR